MMYSRSLAAHPGRLQEVPVAQRQRLGPQLPRAVGPAGERQHRDQDQRCPAFCT